MCQKCHSIIDGEPLRFRGEVYHPYHFNCTGCSQELTSSAREVRTRPGYTAQELNELYCLRCHDKMGIPICGACRCLILSLKSIGCRSMNKIQN